MHLKFLRYQKTFSCFYVNKMVCMPTLCHLSCEVVYLSGVSNHWLLLCVEFWSSVIEITPEWRDAAGQGSDGATAGGYPDQGQVQTPASSSMRRWTVGTENQLKHLRDLCPQEGVGRGRRQGNQFESRRPLRGVFRRLIGSKGPSQTST